jgi:hypothetical protein
MNDTLLEALCDAAGCQGGAIWQFFPGCNEYAVIAMSRSYQDYRRAGLEFPSKAALNKLANIYRLRITW